MWPYKNEAEALNDVLRLSRGMTYKNAVAGLNLGGGKAVIIGDPANGQVRSAVPRVRPVRRFAGRPLHHRRGRRHRRQRHGIRVPRNRIRHRRAPGARRLGRSLAVHRLRHAAGPDGRAQRASSATRKSASTATPCRASATSAWSSSSCCSERGAKVFVTDINKELVAARGRRVRRRGGRPGRDLRRRLPTCTRPCALGGTVNEQTLPRLKAKVICGAANNQLANNAIGDEVQKRGILYAPDYAVNAGGVMNVSLEIDGYNRERAMRMMRTIYHNLARIFEIAERDGIPTYMAADRLAEERIAGDRQAEAAAGPRAAALPGPDPRRALIGTSIRLARRLGPLASAIRRVAAPPDRLRTRRAASNRLITQSPLRHSTMRPFPLGEEIDALRERCRRFAESRDRAARRADRPRQRIPAGPVAQARRDGPARHDRARRIRRQRAWATSPTWSRWRRSRAPRVRSACPTARTPTCACSNLYANGNEAQRSKYLPKLCTRRMQGRAGDERARRRLGRGRLDEPAAPSCAATPGSPTATRCGSPTAPRPTC